VKLGGALREILADSHIAAVSIAVLLLWALTSFFQGLDFLLRLHTYGEMPYFSYSVGDRGALAATLFDLISTAVDVGAAWLVSQWVYGVGPLRSLSRYGSGEAWRKSA
jgi:hypothetical protein